MTEVPKKAKEMFEALSSEEKKVYEERYRLQKEEFDAFKATEAGQRLLKLQKEAKQAGKTPRKTPKAAVARDTPPSKPPGKKAKTGASEEPALALPAKVNAAATALGEAYAGATYQVLLLKVLGTPGLDDKVDPQKALEALRRNQGNVNLTRNELRRAGA